jgi:hypothetical protein
MADRDQATDSVSPHNARVVVWDVPATIECGEPFNVKMGVQCASACRPDGWTIEVRDQAGDQRASAPTGPEPWPDTTGLHYVQVELIAPDTVGLHTWEARAPVNALVVPHTEGVARFGVRTVPAPACLVTVVAVDTESDTPVEGAKVVAHPYRTVTDRHGVATLRVPVGEYRLFVSGKHYFPFRQDCDVAADVTVHADLAVDRELSDADIWV